MQSLVVATGLSRQSIYNIFGDKDGLFRQVLIHYRAIIEQQCRVLHAEDADLISLRAFVLEALKSQRSFGSGACLIVVTAFSPQAQNEDIKPALEDGAQRVRRALETVLARAQLQGELSDKLSISLTASHLYAVMNGLSALQQTGTSQDEIEATLDLAIATLKQHG
jgi:TetR/AcrR family transcriptional repressor of nem operon